MKKENEEALETSTNGGSEMTSSFFDPPLEIYVQISRETNLMLEEDLALINKSENTASTNNSASIFSQNQTSIKTYKDT